MESLLQENFPFAKCETCLLHICLDRDLPAMKLKGLGPCCYYHVFCNSFVFHLNRTLLKKMILTAVETIHAFIMAANYAHKMKSMV